MNCDEIGALIAREIFACGGDPKRPALRITFKDVNEYSMGGFYEKPLAEFIARKLKEYAPSEDR